jgi:2-polyprenyl-6-methoxyphenol hydroxylase-like FAD-dependent oxidoreductase
MDVFLMTRLSDPPLAVLKFPSVAEVRRRVRTCHDGSLPLEPYQLVSQNKVEPLLKEVAEETPNVTVRYGCELVQLDQDREGVTATARLTDGSQETFRSSYLVGCDGGASTVRKQIDVKLAGRGSIREMRQVIFYSEDLYEKIPYGKGRHYTFADAGASTIVAQGDRKEFTLHTWLPEETDFIPFIRNLVGFPCDLKVLHVLTWRHHLLLAERYRDRRVFLAGDAAHLVIPTGGLGMNTGVGDAFDLSWKLAAVTHGWGGERLFESYELERRPVAVRNIEASGWAAEGVPIWLAEVKPEVYDDTPEGADLRHQVAQSFRVNVGRMHGMRGAEFGYTYAGSALVADEPDNLSEWDINVYTPHTRPGVRIPHMWLRNGRALQDVAGDWYTLLDLRGDCDSAALEAAFRDIGAPLDVLRLDEPHMREVYGKSIFLLRPDLHIAWRGDSPPEDSLDLARRVTGLGSATKTARRAEKALSVAAN